MADNTDTNAPTVTLRLDDGEAAQFRATEAWLAGFRSVTAGHYTRPVWVELHHGGTCLARVYVSQDDIDRAAHARYEADR